MGPRHVRARNTPKDQNGRLTTFCVGSSSPALVFWGISRSYSLGPLWAHMAQKQETCFAEGGWRDTIKGGMEKMKDANIVGDDCVKLLGWFKIAFQLAFQTF